MSKTMKWSEIVSNSRKIKKYVDENQKELSIKGYGKGELAYILSKAVKNPGKDVKIEKSYKNCPDCTGNNIYKNLKKDEYLDVATRVIKWMDDKKNDYKAPNFVTYDKTSRISIRLLIYAFAKIIIFYQDNNKKMPNTCWFANAVFYKQTTVTGALCRKLTSLTGITIIDYKTLYKAMMKFAYDYYYEDHQTQGQTLARMKGNCVDLNQVEYYALLEMYPSDVIQIVRGTVRCSDGKIYGHVWCRVKVNGSWINVDASAAAKGKSIGTVICPSVVSITAINPSWAVHDTGDA